MIDQKKKKKFRVLQLLEAKLVLKRIYPDIVQVSGTFWQKFSPAIDHWNGDIVSLMLSKKGTCTLKRL